MNAYVPEHARANESAALLLGDGVRFLVSIESPRKLLEGNAAFTDLTSLSPFKYRGSPLSSVYCSSTDGDLLESTISEACRGNESSCGVVLTSRELLVQVHCVPVFHSAYQVCILCVALPIAPLPSSDCAAALVLPTKDFNLLFATSEWIELLGYATMADDGRAGSLEQLRGPLSETDRFGAMLDGVRRCVCLDVAAVAHRRDGAHALMAFRLHPVLCPADGGAARRVAVVVEARPLEPLCHAGALLAAAGGAASLDAMVGRLSLADPPPPLVPAGPAADDGASSESAAAAEVEVQAPAGLPGVLGPLLAELHREGLVLHWAWARPPRHTAAAGGGGGGGACRVRANLDAVRRRARRAGRCRTGLLCLWLLALARPPPPAPAACGAAAGGGAESGTDFGFLSAGSR